MYKNVVRQVTWHNIVSSDRPVNDHAMKNRQESALGAFNAEDGSAFLRLCHQHVSFFYPLVLNYIVLCKSFGSPPPPPSVVHNPIPPEPCTQDVVAALLSDCFSMVNLFYPSPSVAR